MPRSRRAIVLVVVAWAACGCSSSERASPGPLANQGASDVKIKDSCGDAVRMIRARDFREWHGLPADCTPDLLARELARASASEGHRQLGSDAVDVIWWTAQVAGYSAPLEVQVARSAVVRIDGERPQLAGGLEAHLVALAAPAGKLPYHADVVKIADGEWVWPERGIAIYLNPDHRFVNRIALFRGTDLPTYQRELEPNLRVYEEP
jgi:hypothetical protein